MFFDNQRELLSCLILVLGLCLHASDKTSFEMDSLTMHQEADIFLASMPDGLQRQQAIAVDAAIKGDLTVLNEVRNSRNILPLYSENIKVKDFNIPGNNGRAIPVRLYSPALNDNSDSLPLLIYFHGGGWTFGSLNSCARFCDAVASSGKAKVLAVDYALAPEHPYPEGLLECADVVEYAFEHNKELGIAQNLISLGGDSSGGNLALATSIYNLDHTNLPIRSIVLFYPVVLAENDGSNSWLRYGDGYSLDSNLMEKFNEAYCSSYSSTKTETVSPMCAPDTTLKRLPPILMINAERDILTSQGSVFAKHVSELGVPIEHITFPGTVHLFITVSGQDTAFSKSIETTISFIGLD
jgi:acetyl esterase